MIPELHILKKEVISCGPVEHIGLEVGYWPKGEIKSPFVDNVIYSLIPTDSLYGLLHQ